ncbi:MAG: hypothetical protein KAG61_05000 [Bacteriovoracaceae bacterium]|nr:hypothetical protein [Bacteriovoracaceae bacterium]
MVTKYEKIKSFIIATVSSDLNFLIAKDSMALESLIIDLEMKIEQIPPSDDKIKLIATTTLLEIMALEIEFNLQISVERYLITAKKIIKSTDCI